MKILKFIIVSAAIMLSCTACGSDSPDPQPQTKSYALSLQGNVIPGTAKGVSFDLVLPAGVSVNISSPDSSVLSSSLSKTDSMPSNAIIGAKYSSGIVTIAIITTQGINTGSFATLTCNIPSGVVAPQGSAFTVNNQKVVDVNGNSIAGVTVTIQ